MYRYQHESGQYSWNSGDNKSLRRIAMPDVMPILLYGYFPLSVTHHACACATLPGQLHVGKICEKRSNCKKLMLLKLMLAPTANDAGFGL